MKINQRALLWGAILGAALVVLALRVLPPVFVVLGLAVLALVGLVVWSRMRGRTEGASDDEWSAGDEWGLSSDDDDDYVDLDDRLAGLGLADEPVHEEDAEEYVEVEDVVVEDDGHGLFAEAARYDLVVEGEGPDALVEEYVEEEYVEETYDDEPAAVDEYVEEEDVEEEDVVEDDDDIFAAPGVIDEEKVDSDQAILAASSASRLQYEEVLTREDANAETREILSRVASLLAKYE